MTNPSNACNPDMNECTTNSQCRDDQLCTAHFNHQCVSENLCVANDGVLVPQLSCTSGSCCNFTIPPTATPTDVPEYTNLCNLCINEGTPQGYCQAQPAPCIPGGCSSNSECQQNQVGCPQGFSYCEGNVLHYCRSDQSGYDQVTCSGDRAYCDAALRQCVVGPSPTPVPQDYCASPAASCFAYESKLCTDSQGRTGVQMCTYSRCSITPPFTCSGEASCSECNVLEEMECREQCEALGNTAQECGNLPPCPELLVPTLNECTSLSAGDLCLVDGVTPGRCQGSSTNLTCTAIIEKPVGSSCVDDFDCESFNCVQVSNGGVKMCAPKDRLPKGAPCESDIQCESLFCDYSMNSGGFCALAPNGETQFYAGDANIIPQESEWVQNAYVYCEHLGVSGVDCDRAVQASLEGGRENGGNYCVPLLVDLGYSPEEAQDECNALVTSSLLIGAGLVGGGVAATAPAWGPAALTAGTSVWGGMGAGITTAAQYIAAYGYAAYVALPAAAQQALSLGIEMWVVVNLLQDLSACSPLTGDPTSCQIAMLSYLPTNYTDEMRFRNEFPDYAPYFDGTIEPDLSIIPDLWQRVTDAGNQQYITPNDTNFALVLQYFEAQLGRDATPAEIAQVIYEFSERQIRFRNPWDTRENVVGFETYDFVGNRFVPDPNIGFGISSVCNELAVCQSALMANRGIPHNVRRLLLEDENGPLGGHVVIDWFDSNTGEHMMSDPTWGVGTVSVNDHQLNFPNIKFFDNGTRDIFIPRTR